MSSWRNYVISRYISFIEVLAVAVITQCAINRRGYILREDGTSVVEADTWDHTVTWAVFSNAFRFDTNVGPQLLPGGSLSAANQAPGNGNEQKGDDNQQKGDDNQRP